MSASGSSLSDVGVDSHEAAVASALKKPKSLDNLQVDLEEEEEEFVAPSSPSGSEATPEKDADKKDAEKKDGAAPAAPAEAVPYKQLLRYSDWKDRVLWGLGVFCGCANGAVMPLFSLIFGEMINAFNEPGAISKKVAEYAVWFCILAAVSFVTGYLEVSTFMISAERQTRRIREKYLAAILRQDISWFDVEKTGELSTRLASDTMVIQDAIGEKVGNYIHFTATFFCGIILGFVKGWQLTLVIMSVAPLLAIAGGFIMKLMASSTAKGQAAYAAAGSVAEEVVGSMRTVQSLSVEGKQIDRYQANLNDAEVIGIKKGILSGVGLGVTMMIMFSSYALSFWVGSELIVNQVTNAATGKPFTGGDVVTVFFSVLIGAMALGQAAPNLPFFASGKGAGFKVFQVIDRASPIDATSPEGKKLPKVEGNIEFKNVTFRYPARTEVQILRGLNLVVPAGKTTALVGASGCGKSTTVALAQRFYDPEGGEVLVDGQNVKEFNVKWWRSQIGVVSQEPVLFGTSTILENILRSNPDATMAEVEAACRIANAEEFILNLPNKYQTYIGDGGSQLSGGQKQRIAIARAIVRAPRILLLDEATSALDSKSEREVQVALDRVMKDRTTIVIAHRLSTIQKADKICVISEGQLVEEGTHAELMDLQGAYYALVQAQNEKVREGKDDEPSSPSGAASSSSSPSSPSASASVAQTKSEVAKKDDAAAQEKMNPLPRILHLNKPELVWIVFGILAAGLNGAIMPLFSLIFSEFVTVFYKPADQLRDDAKVIAGLFVALGVGAFIFNYVQFSFFTTAGERLTTRMRAMAFRSILRQNIAFFDLKTNNVGALTARLAVDASLVQNAGGIKLGQLVQVILMMGVGLGIAFANGPKLAAVVLACAPLIALAGALQMTFMKGFSTEAKKLYEDSSVVASEAISSIRTVVSLGLEDSIASDYSKRLDRPTAIGVRSGFLGGISLGCSQSLMFFSYALAFWYGSTLIEKGEMDFGQVMKVFMAIILSAMGVGQTTAMVPDGAKAHSAAIEIFKLVDTVPPIDTTSEQGTKPAKCEGSVEFSDVHFHYESRSETKLLRGISFTAKPGQKIALVGASGSGKSTCFSLVERFYDPVSGTVKVDGHDIRDLNINWLRSQFGFVGQEPVLFEGTIAENIAMGLPGASLEQIKEAARLANADAFIMKKPLGYDTPVGRKGGQLSGGQKQRIAIARAIIRSPPILLLDEATSALDPVAEKLVQRALDRVMKGRTTLVIAHRLSTIQDSDCIIVFKEGLVTEQGSHEQLIALDGVYANLVRTQAGH